MADPKVNRNDPRSSVIYSLMIDRFVDAEPNPYDQYYDTDCHCWKKITGGTSEADPTHANPYRFWGGDIRGVIQAAQSGYFNDLGVNLLHITPFFQNSYFSPDDWAYVPYHGYYPEDLFRVDPRFGSNEDLEELAKVLTERGIRMAVDVVYNHSNERCNPYGLGRVLKGGEFLFDVRGEWDGGPHFTRPDADHLYIVGKDDQHNSLFGVMRKNVERRYELPKGAILEYQKEAQERAWPPLPCVVNGAIQPSGLADLNYEDPNGAVGNNTIGAMRFWKQELGDALAWFRMDAAIFVPHTFNRRMFREFSDTPFLLELMPMPAHPFTPSEKDTPEESQWKQRFTTPIFDDFKRHQVTIYDFKSVQLLEKIINEHFSDESLNQLLDTWSIKPDDPDTYLVGYVASHDTDRLATDNPALKRILLAMMLTAPRIPYIYYGEEGANIQPIPNAGFMDRTRGYMGTEGIERARKSKEFQVISRLIKLRKDHPVFFRGGLRVVAKPNEGVFAYERYYEKSSLLIVINGQKTAASLDKKIAVSLPDGEYRDILEGNADGWTKIQVRNGRIISPLNVPAQSIAVYHL